MDRQTAKKILSGWTGDDIATLKSGKVPSYIMRRVLTECLPGLSFNTYPYRAAFDIAFEINRQLEAARALASELEWRPVTPDDVGKGPVQVKDMNGKVFVYDIYAGSVLVHGTTHYVVYDAEYAEGYDDADAFTNCEILVS